MNERSRDWHVELQRRADRLRISPEPVVVELAPVVPLAERVADALAGTDGLTAEQVSAVIGTSAGAIGNCLVRDRDMFRRTGKLRSVPDAGPPWYGTPSTVWRLAIPGWQKGPGG